MNRFSLFPTPVFVFDLPLPSEVNAELVSRLVAEEQAAPGVSRSNIGGWHSVPDLTLRQEPCYQKLIQAIVEHVAFVMNGLARESGRPPMQFNFGVQGWAMVMRNSHYITIHDHGDAHWSVAYYADAGDAGDAPSGQLAFVDPRRSGRTIPNADIFESSFSVTPRTGALVIFPGWLQHYVHEYRGTRPRVSISCNLTLEPMQAPR